MRPNPARTLALALALAALTAGVGCGEKPEDVAATGERFDLALDWYPNPDHAGIYVALERGHFADAGLDVSPRAPSDPSAPIKQVAAGRADLAVSYQPEVVIARDQGLDVVAVAALASEPLTSLVSLPGPGAVREPGDLRGKRVATAGIPYQRSYLEAILDRARLEPGDVEQVDVGLGLLPSLLSGRVDAVLGMFWNVEGVELRERGEDPIILPVDRLGIPTYDELVLVANRERVESDPEAIELFLEALERGTDDVRRNPQAAAAALVNANPDLDQKLTRAQVTATLPALAGVRGRPYGYMSPREWERFAGFLADQGVVESRLGAAELLTNELLPGEVGQ